MKQQINFIGRLEIDEGATMFFITEKSGETTFEFSQNSATIVSDFTLHIIMQTQKITNLLGNADNDNESLKFATRKWYVINDQNNADYGDGDKMVQPLHLRLKSLNQIFVIIQTHLFL